MKHFLKITNSRWAPRSNTKMIYETEEGIEFIGTAAIAEVEAGKTVVVELSERPMKDGYYHVIQFLGAI